ncbi:MAG TPA: CPBP family intramembrane metalloprotease [Chloroflexota bacterium]|nr:CPBP family intramembrane metalloprotease [Chloroflexota bacterium]HUM70815.1 CPBP family intramembrane metalloprotease [Chloroflexota bacterium]
MASKKARKGQRPSQRPSRSTLSPQNRVLVALVVPVLAGLLIAWLTGLLAAGAAASSGSRAPVWAAVGLAAWFVGMAFYGLPGMGLKGGRPLFAGIAFATLGWITFLLLRAIFIPINPAVAGSTRAFIYTLLFEAFALQLWTFGLLFRAIADWRGPLTAATASGVVFGAIGFLLFQNVYTASLVTLIYYTVWGVFYGIIRLRTGSLLGTVIIQAMQIFTAWVALGSMPPETAEVQLLWVYGLAAVITAVFIWRLWPKVESDYRV